MPIATPRVLRFGRTWLNGRADLVEEELTLTRGDRSVPATFLRPRSSARPLPGWIVLHGITRPGRRHLQLQRFSRALASTGAAALVPEVPEWVELDLTPELTVPTVDAAVAALREHPTVARGPLVLAGFSFGAPHAIAAAAAPSVHPEVGGVVGFGGYCDLQRTIRFMLTGRHEWGDASYHLPPDPYGRWIVAANYLTAVKGHEDAQDVADALRRLAAIAGDDGAPSWDPRYEPAKAELRSTVAAERRALFDLFAPASDAEPDLDEGERMAERLAEAAARVHPAMDPGPSLARVRRPVHVLHGRYDRLIPFTEGLRLQRALAGAEWSRTTVTRLFGHSGQDPFPGVIEGARELTRFVRALHGVLGIA